MTFGLSLWNGLFHSDKKINGKVLENIPIRIIFLKSISIPIPAIHFLLMYCLKKTCHRAAVSVSESAFDKDLQVAQNIAYYMYNFACNFCQKQYSVW